MEKMKNLIELLTGRRKIKDEHLSVKEARRLLGSAPENTDFHIEYWDANHAYNFETEGYRDRRETLSLLGGFLQFKGKVARHKIYSTKEHDRHSIKITESYYFTAPRRKKSALHMGTKSVSITYEIMPWEKIYEAGQ
jgi:hypothetical protein